MIWSDVCYQVQLSVCYVMVELWYPCKYQFTLWQVSISIRFISLSIKSEHRINAASHSSHKLVHTISTPWQVSFINSIYQFLNQLKTPIQGSLPLYHKPCNINEVIQETIEKLKLMYHTISFRTDRMCTATFFQRHHTQWYWKCSTNLPIKLSITCSSYQWSTYESHLHSCLHPFSWGPCQPRSSTLALTSQCLHQIRRSACHLLHLLAVSFAWCQCNSDSCSRAPHSPSTCRTPVKEEIIRLMHAT